MKMTVPFLLKDKEDLIVSDVFTNSIEHTNLLPTWNALIYIYQGDLLVYSGHLYRAMENSLGKAPDLYVGDFWYDFGLWTNTTADAYNPATTYALNQLCYHEIGYKHYIYSSNVASNVGNKPSATVGDKWTKVGAVNLYRCLDDKTNNKTARTDSLWLRVKTYKADTVALIGIRAKSATITVYDSLGNVLSTDNRASLQYKGATSWMSYFFGDFKYKTDITSQVNLGFNNEVKVEVVNTGNIARLGRLVIGKSFDIGTTNYGGDSGILDFSLKERDAIFGDESIKQGNYADIHSIKVNILTSRISEIKQFLTSIRGKEVLLNANNGGDYYDYLITYGFVQDFKVIHEGPVMSTLSIKFEGLI